MVFRSYFGKPRAIPYGAATSSRSAPRRNVTSQKELLSKPHPEVSTLYELLQHSERVNGSKRSMGTRPIVRTVTEEKEVTKMVDGEKVTETKKWNFYELGPYEWMTFSEVRRCVLDFGSGLRNIGMNPGDKITIFAATSRDWQLVAHAAWSQSLTITTAYDTLGEEGLTFSLNECEIGTVFTNADLLRMIQKIAPNVPTLRNVIYNGEADEKLIAAITEQYPHLKFFKLYDDIRKMGTDKPVDPVPPKPEDIACIMYTSGSTGNPKGVLLGHDNLVAGVAGAKNLTDAFITKNETYLAYLPLAHVLELLVEQLCLCEGVEMGYGAVRTLTDQSVRNCLGDIRELKPTFMTGVPAVWESIRKAVKGKLAEQPPTAQKIFQIACALKWKLLELGLPTTFLDKTIFKKIRDGTGGRLKFALSGGAPMPKETQKFMTTCICIIVQGYGMTETCAASAIQLPSDPWMLSRVGPPTAAVEILVAAVPDTKYHPTNSPRPQGEIWIRGPTVMRGYYKNESATRETLSEDGWMMTGDIGEIHPDGTISIIDRKKNLVKLSNGEYVALERLESQYKFSSYVHNICVYGDSEQSFVVAIINPVEKEVRRFAEEKGLSQPDMDFDEVCKIKDVKKEILRDLKDVAKKAGFKGAEILGGIWLVSELWTPENGFLTAAQKLKRAEIVDANREYIDKMYASGRR
ncbi:hypothetical protein BC832DRAFT_529632 [Gaertneriomyces semiglobifer]|nr:hypothetical protein BC832DRAFT_529632 [Gaertneriomyces semiglobifer]